MAHAVVNAALAAAQGQNAAAGALTESEKETVSALATLASGLAGGLVGDNTQSTAYAAQAGKTTVENNYLSNQQRSERDKEFDACKGNTSCQLKVGAKWDATDIKQEVAYGAGMLVGVPQGISDSVEGLSKAITNPAATYDAIKLLITSDDMFSTMSDAVKQGYIDRINRMESEYQRAGAGGAYNAGLEAGKLVSYLVTAVAGGAGLAKTGGVLTEKIVAKVAGKAEAAAVNAGKVPKNPNSLSAITDNEAGGYSYYDKFKNADGGWNWS